MKHIKTFEHFTLLAESDQYAWEWNANKKALLWINQGQKNTFINSMILCQDGELIAAYEAIGRSYTAKLGVKCDPKKWESEGNKLVEILAKLSPEDSSGIFWKPIDANAKKIVSNALKTALK